MVIEHIIAGNIIPHNEGAIPLTKEAYDVNNPQKRLTDFSKTITIPSDKTVNQIFEHSFDVNIQFQTFNPNLKTSYQIVQDGVLVMDGYCQLSSIDNVDGLITYKILATGKVGNLFEIIKEKYLQDLDLTALDHTWNEFNIESSWSAPIGEGYVYPMIDFGRSRFNQWEVDDFKPAIYLKQYIDAIISEAGFTYESGFFDTTLFKSLIVPYGSGQILLDNAAILCREFLLNSEGGQTVPCHNFSSFQNVDDSTLIFGDDGGIGFYTNRVIADGGVVENVACLEAAYGTNPNLYNTCNNEYNLSTGQFVAAQDGEFTFQGQLNFDMKYTESNANTTYYLNEVANPFSKVEADFRANVRVQLVERTGLVYKVVDTIYPSITDSALANTLQSGTGVVTNLPNNVASFRTGKIQVKQGSKYFFAVGKVRYSGTRIVFNLNQPTNIPIYQDNFSDFEFTLNESTLANKLSDKQLLAGGNIDTRLVVPNNIKQIDLFSSIIKRFNLYIDYDIFDPNKLIIETRDDYLTEDKVDIETMVDRSKSYDIKPLGALDAGRYIFSDKLDKDSLNEVYNSTTDEVYGQKIVDVDNDFITKDKTISTIFAPTPLLSYDNNDRKLSAIIFLDKEGKTTQANAKIRLLYWGGLLPTANYWNLGSNPSYQNYPNYPYAGHLDSPYVPTFDLNWGTPKELFYDFTFGEPQTFTYPNTNCYNFFWSKYINEITDKNSKILECYLSLRPYDYNELSFRKSYYIDGNYWRLLKVTDFDAVGEATTKCSFLLTEPKDAFVGDIKPIRGGGGVYDTDEKVPIGDTLVRPNRNSGQSYDTLQFGENVKGGKRSLIASDNVSQSFNSVNALVVGSDNAQINADNVTMINSPSISTIRPNEAYINGLFVEKLASIVIPYDVLINVENELQILPPLAADEFYEVTRAYARLNGNAATGGAHQVDVVTDDASAHLLAKIASAFFNTDNNTDVVEVFDHNTTPIHFGSGLKLFSNNNMSFDAGTSLTLNLVYRIIKL
tara:strand:- start:3111 stop:6137 length:3027 start_codon:yes stop_codon:yes gene_type:complete